MSLFAIEGLDSLLRKNIDLRITPRADIFWMNIFQQELHFQYSLRNSMRSVQFLDCRIYGENALSFGKLKFTHRAKSR